MTRIPDGSIDLICCDLPYSVTYNPWDTLIPLEPLWTQYKRIIKPKGAIVLTATQPFATTLIASNPKWFRYEWMWIKNDAVGHLNSHKMPMNKHEHVLVFGSKLPNYYPQGVRGCKPKTRTNRQCTNYQKMEKPTTQTLAGYPTTVLNFKRDKEKLHPTQKPVALIQYLVETYTKPGETVLDNCFGSGTAAIACANADRNFIGFELDAKYFRLAEDRINSHTVGAASIEHLFV